MTPYPTILQACRHGYADVISRIIQLCEVNIHNRRLKLHECISETTNARQYDTLKLLLEELEKQPYNQKLYGQSISEATELNAESVRPRCDEARVLHLVAEDAIRRDNVEVIDIMWRYAPGVVRTEDPALSYHRSHQYRERILRALKMAITWGRPTIMQRLLEEKDCQVNTTDLSGNSVVHDAVMRTSQGAWLVFSANLCLSMDFILISFRYNILRLFTYGL